MGQIHQAGGVVSTSCSAAHPETFLVRADEVIE